MIVTKEIRTTKKEEFIDITHLILDELAKHNISEGRALIFIPHTTAGITINENADPNVRKDIILGLKSLGIESLGFSHAEGNSPAHIKSSIIGCSLDVIISGSRLLLGTWQGIYFCEFDGPRNRKVVIQF
jgi:secondary thiamine-phosphate synthase enzyme